MPAWQKIRSSSFWSSARRAANPQGPEGAPTRRAFYRSVRLHRRPDVLIHAEEVFGVVLSFDRRQSIVVASVRGTNPVLAFVHHEIHISPAGAEWVQRIVVPLGPIGNFAAVRWIRIHAHNHFAEDGIAIAECRIAFAYPMHLSIHRIQVHGRSP